MTFRKLNGLSGDLVEPGSSEHAQASALLEEWRPLVDAEISLQFSEFDQYNTMLATLDDFELDIIFVRELLSNFKITQYADA